ncbi:MAG: hypothetical protein IJ405_07705 [Lachnospiraceae bacterium]|nr:hypothetical protein [Lachnospiraceae bacterium]
MKRLHKITTLVMMVIMLVGLTACTKKTAISVNEFNDIMESKGCTIVDATGQLVPESIPAISLALSDEWQIEFYEFVDNDTAAAVFQENKIIFERAADSGASAEITKNIMNYSYYSASTSSTFYMLAQIDNTMLYVEADVAYKDEIVEIVKELGY